MIEADIRKVRELEVAWAAHDPKDEVIPLILRALDEREALLRSLKEVLEELDDPVWRACRDPARRAIKWAEGP